MLAKQLETAARYVLQTWKSTWSAVRRVTHASAECLSKGAGAVRGAAVGPQPQDPYRAHQWEMAGAHAMFLHSLRGIYEVRTTDVAP